MMVHYCTLFQAVRPPRQFRLHQSRSLPILIFLLCLSSSIAQAGEWLYLENANFALHLLPPPPERGSAEEKADFEAIKWATNVCTAEQRTRALLEETNFSVFICFENDIGSFFQSNNFPITSAFLSRALSDTDQVLDATKARWHRARPVPELVDLYGEKETNCYPSGHSTRGTVLSLILAELFPANQAAVLAKGRELGWHRVLLGLHYPSDIYAGRVLGIDIVSKFKRSRRYQHDFQRAMKEITNYGKHAGVNMKANGRRPSRRTTRVS